MLLKGAVPFLELSSMLSYPNVKLVSTEGSSFHMNHALLAAASQRLASLIKEQEDFEDIVIFTELAEKELSLFCQFVSTGMVAVEQPNKIGPLQDVFSYLGLDTTNNKAETVTHEEMKGIEKSRDMVLFSMKTIKFQEDSMKLKGVNKVAVKTEIEEDMDFSEGMFDQVDPLVSAYFTHNICTGELKDNGFQKKTATKAKQERKTASKPEISKPKKFVTNTSKTKGSNIEITGAFGYLMRQNEAGEVEWVCDDCQVQFDSPYDIIRHKCQDHTDKYKKCDRCKGAMKLHCASNIKYHTTYISHNKRKKGGTGKMCTDVPLQCVYCGIVERSKLRLEKHLQATSHDDKCAICSKAFDTFGEHRYHVLTAHDGKFLVRCKTCLEFFEDERQRNNHSKFMHPKNPKKEETQEVETKEETNPKERCTDCEDQFDTFTDLVNHQKEVHGKDIIFCTICHKELRNEKLFAAHMKNHQQVIVKEEEPEETAEAKPSKANSEDEDWELNSSTAEGRDFKCDECPKTFKTIWTMRQHILQHKSFDPLKPWCCFFCPDKFASGQDLQAHENEGHYKPIGLDTRGRQCVQCPFCLKLFEGQSRRLKVQFHMTKVHKDELPQNKSTLTSVLKLDVNECVCCGKRFTFASSVKKHQRQGLFLNRERANRF